MIFPERVLNQTPTTQRAQYPLIREYTLNHKGIHIMV